MNNSNYQIYLTTINDLEAVMSIYEHARSFMRANNNLEQWINGYPSKEVILEDIALKQSFVIRKDGVIIAVFTFINGKDETYDYIEGRWLNDEPYGVIHRIASSHQEKGMLKVAIDYCFNYVNNIRIDTHKDNIVMQNALIKEGFRKCGVIYLKDGHPRYAYQRMKEDNSIIDTTMIYLKKDNSYLLLFRNKKKNDINEGKWIGVGGHREPNETIDECAIREVKEETGLDVHSLSCSGEVLFVDENLKMMMYIYEITDFSGELIECNEGDLKWIPIKDIYNYPMWEGDKAFLPKLINHEPYFKMTLTYKNNELISVENY